MTRVDSAVGVFLLRFKDLKMLFKDVVVDLSSFKGVVVVVDLSSFKDVVVDLCC